MRKIVTLAAAGLALMGALALAGCGPRANNLGNVSSNQQNGSQGSVNQAGQPGSGDVSSADANLSSVDSVLSDVDAGLASTSTTPEDAD
jgi:hypothetical protein